MTTTSRAADADTDRGDHRREFLVQLPQGTRTHRAVLRTCTTAALSVVRPQGISALPPHVKQASGRDIIGRRPFAGNPRLAVQRAVDLAPVGRSKQGRGLVRSRYGMGGIGAYGEDINPKPGPVAQCIKRLTKKAWLP